MLIEKQPVKNLDSAKHLPARGRRRNLGRAQGVHPQPIDQARRKRLGGPAIAIGAMGVRFELGEAAAHVRKVRHATGKARAVGG
jgi:hypothetical protein